MERASALYRDVLSSDSAIAREASEAHIGLAAIDYYQGRVESALNHLDISDELFPPFKELNATNRAIYMIAMNRPDEAIRDMTAKSRNLKRKGLAEREGSYIGCQAILARAYWMKDDPARGLKTLRSLRAECDVEKYPLLEALVLTYEGYMQFHVEQKYGVSAGSSRMADASSKLKKAVEIIERIDYREAGGEPYRFLAEIYLAMGDHQKAGVAARRAYRAAFIIGERIEVANAEMLLGVIAFREAEIDQAAARLSRAKAIFEEVGVQMKLESFNLLDLNLVRAS